MMNACAATAPGIEIRRLIPAPRDRVFAAWTEPLLLARWFAPNELQAEVEQLEPHRGGRFRVSMHGDDGESHTVFGTFVELASPQRLQLTWRWLGEPEPASLVTVDFLDLDTGTEVVIDHRQLPPEAAALHREGWIACLQKLGALSQELAS